jgi:hypothetical protein
MFIPLIVGVLLSAACAPFVNKHYLGLVKKHNGHPPAEARLIPMMLSCWFIPIGMFIFAWTSYKELHWAGPAMGGFSVGFGFIFLYNAANNYLVDSYQHQAASALAAKTFLRSFWGACSVLFTVQMYDRLGDQWASSLLGFIGLGCSSFTSLARASGRIRTLPTTRTRSSRARRSRHGRRVGTEEFLQNVVSTVYSQKVVTIINQ